MAGMTTGDNAYSPSRYIVNSQPGLGTHTTLAGACAVAVSGDTITIMTSVTENVNLPAGVGLIGSHDYIQVTGTITVNTAGTANIQNLTLQTNGAPSVIVSGANSTAVYLQNCFINNTNATSLSCTNTVSGSGIIMRECYGSMTAGNALFAVSSGQAQVQIYDTFMDNDGSSTTASTFAGASLTCQNCIFYNPITISGSSTATFTDCAIVPGNATSITTTSSGAITSVGGFYSSGSASAINIGSTSSFGSVNDNVSSTNTNAITGTAGGIFSASMLTLSASGTGGVNQALTVNLLPISSLFVKGPRADNYTATAVSYQVLLTDCIIGVTSTSAPRTITMPSAGMYTGQRWTIKDESAAAATNNITISGNGHNIVGISSATTYVINSNGGSVDLYWNGNLFMVS